MQRPKAFLSISVGGAHAGRVVVELRPDVAPLATENFLALCRGDRVSAGGRHLTYARSSFHRVIPGFSESLRLAHGRRGGRKVTAGLAASLSATDEPWQPLPPAAASC